MSIGATCLDACPSANSLVLLLVVGGDDEAREFGRHVRPDTGQTHLQRVDRAAMFEVFLSVVVRKLGAL